MERRRAPAAAIMLPVVRALFLILLPVLLACCGRKATPAPARSGPMDPPAFWVWHRSSPLAGKEVSKLRTAGVRDLYWQALECGWEDGRWKSTRIARPMPAITDITVTPVFRIKPDAAFLREGGSPALLAKMIRLWSEDMPLQALQLDFDCPDRSLEAYAKFLRTLGEQLPSARISITALAGWPRHSGFRILAESVSMMAPMFYDLHVDTAADVKARRFRPLADSADLALIDLWKNCPVPWLAGLPNFERVSVFTPDGGLSGHLRGWSHDGVFFHSGLVLQPERNGITLYEVRNALSVADNAVAAGSMLVHRTPRMEMLERMSEAASVAGAKGVIYFTLPGPGIQSPYDAPRLGGSRPPLPAITVSAEGIVTVTNNSATDLPPRACDPATGMRGWWIEGRAKASGAFRSSSPGGFAMLSTEGNDPAETATVLRLHFSELVGGESISSGRLADRPGDITWSFPESF